jgi:hypothetical protein
VATSGTVFSGDTLSGGAFAFDNKNAGTAKTVAVSGVSVNDGNSGANYNVSYANNTNSTINQADLTLTAASDTKTYNGNTNSSGVVNYAGLQSGDTLTGLSQSFDSKNAGSRTLSAINAYTLTDGNSGNNYNVIKMNASGTVNKANLIIAANNDSKRFDNIAYQGGNGVTYSGFVAGEGISELAGSLNYAGSAQGAVGVGSYSVNPNGLSADNYATIFIDGALDITSTSQAAVALGNILLVSAYEGLQAEVTPRRSSQEASAPEDIKHSRTASLEVVVAV